MKLLSAILVILATLTQHVVSLKIQAELQEAMDDMSSLFNSMENAFTFTEDVYESDSGSSAKKKEDEDQFGIGGFFLGLILIPFSIVLLWKNEKKLVTYARCMQRAAKEVITVNIKEADEMNNFLLVHCIGKTENKQSIADHEFLVSADNSYRLKRIVEMYQWQEIVRSEERQDRQGRNYTHYTYTYNKVWSQSPISSRNFHKQGFDNPVNAWPFSSKTVEA